MDMSNAESYWRPVVGDLDGEWCNSVGCGEDVATALGRRHHDAH